MSMSGIALLHFSQHPIGVDRRAVIPFFIGIYIFVVDDHAPFLAQILLEGCDCFIETLVEVFGRVEHGCVGEFESHNKSPLEV